MTAREELIQRARARMELLRRKAQKGDFWAYCLFMDYEFFSKRPVLKIIADAFQQVHDAYAKGLSLNVAASLPPRAGKSYITSLFASFMLCQFPTESVMRNTCTATLYDKFSYDTRDIIKSDRTRMVFPNVELSRDQQNIGGWSLKQAKQVSYFGAGVGGTIIGFGASMLAMTDDLFKDFEDAMSENVNDKTWTWKEGAHDSRVERNCCKIDIGTRWSETDVLGRLEAMGKYNVIVRIPALDENGETFCEDVHTSEYYRELESEIDEFIWMAEYMQQPIEKKGLLFPKSELKWFTLDEIKDKQADARIAATDTADKGNDDLCSPFADFFEDRFFIKDVVFTKDSIEITEPRVAQMILENRTEKILIESNNGGRSFSLNVEKLIKGQSTCEVDSRPTTSNKETRILMKSGFVKKYFWFRSDYERGSDYDRFIKALTGYKKEGGNKHDDAADGVTILAEFIEHLGLLTGKKNNQPQSKSALGFY
jgi:predicted phage terminase large subunit-like protein